MKIFNRNSLPIDDVLNSNIKAAIEKSLSGICTLDAKFIVNDTLWFARNRKGDISPCVVNSAGFLSKTFQKNLGEIPNWKGETRIDKQNFDGFGTLPTTKTSFKLSEQNLIPFLKEYLSTIGEPEYLISKYFSIFYGMYVNRSLFQIDDVPENLHRYFSEEISDPVMRVGVEFETGNIGSSFRALMKLNNLFLKSHIDVGVFITSNDKSNCACRIWPTSNRNGSFVELENRNYSDSIQLPLLEYGFAPDAFNVESPYLGEDCSLFFPKKTSKMIRHKGKAYEVFIGLNNDEILMELAN